MVTPRCALIGLPPKPEFLDNRWRAWTAAELVQRAVANPPTFEPPGEAVAYSNTNYTLLGQIIEKVTSHSYGDEIKRRVIALTPEFPGDPDKAVDAFLNKAICA